MMEGFAVLSIVASITQLVDLTAKAIRRLDEFQSAYGEVPESLKYIKAELPLISKTISQVKVSVDRKQFDDESIECVLPVVQGLENEIEKLNTVLVKILPVHTDNRAKKVFKSIDSLLKDDKIEHIMKTVRGYISSLTFHYTASLSTWKPSTDDKLHKIRQWLAAPEPLINYKKALKLRQPGTGQWFLQGQQFSNWMANPGWIWLHGIPGCGKTVLSSTILEKVFQATSKDRSKVVAYFYFDFKDEQKQNPGNMVKSLISQLSKQAINMPTMLEDLYSSCDKGRRQPLLEELLPVLQELITNFPNVFVIIDALDECGERSALVEALEDISLWQRQGLGMHLLLTGRKERDLEEFLEEIISGDNILCIESQTIDDDIRLYTRQRLLTDKNFKKWKGDVDLLQEIESLLVEKADGMFRWVVCQFDAFGSCRNRLQLREALVNLPATLDETYERILLSIEKSDVKYAVRILTWIAFAKMPLNVGQIAEAAAIDIERHPSFNRDEVLQDPLDMLRICSSLIPTFNAFDKVVSEANPPKADFSLRIPLPERALSVSLAHYSVKEYLLSERILESPVSIYSLNSGVGNSFMAQCCLKYLLQFDTPDAINRANYTEFLLALYSAKQWFVHYRSTDHEIGELDFLVRQLFKPTNPAFIAWVQLKIPRPDPPFSLKPKQILHPVYYASKLNLSRAVKDLVLFEDVDINTESDRYNGSSILKRFVRAKNTQMVHWLIIHGAKVSFQWAATKGFDDFIHQSIDNTANCVQRERDLQESLAIAAEKGHTNVVRVLLDHHVAVNPPWEHTSSLEPASAGGHREIVDLLLAYGAKVDPQPRYVRPGWGSALVQAILGGHVDIYEVLLKEGANVNFNDDYWGTALQAACESGSKDLVRLLLEKGADPSIGGTRFSTALEAACAVAVKDIVLLLLDEGVDINANRNGRTALRAACALAEENIPHWLLGEGATGLSRAILTGPTRRIRHSDEVSPVRLDIVQLLLDRGAETDAKGKFGRTALWEACAKPNSPAEIARLLLDGGADPNTKDSKQRSAICIAVKTGNLSIVWLLIARGADVNTRLRGHGSALKIAIRNGDTDMISLLLSSGAYPYPKLRGGKSEIYRAALKIACERGNLEVVKMLSDAGANLNTSLTKWKNELHSLHVACTEGHVGIVLLHLQRGADVNATTGRYGSALQAACSSGATEVVLLLLDKGADISPDEDAGVYGNAVKAACWGGHADVVQMLFDRGVKCNVNATKRYPSALSAVRYGINWLGSTQDDVAKPFKDKRRNYDRINKLLGEHGVEE